VEKAFRKVGIEIDWRGKGAEEHGVDASSGRTVVEVDPRYFRPTEVDFLRGDPSKAHERLGWRHEASVDEIVAEMVREDLKAMARMVPMPATTMGLMHV
jgi:GDPmannose 4,6-dehydratase